MHKHYSADASRDRRVCFVETAATSELECKRYSADASPVRKVRSFETEAPRLLLSNNYSAQSRDKEVFLLTEAISMLIKLRQEGMFV